MTNSVSPQDVAHVATLANLPVSVQQQQEFAVAFSATLEEIQHLAELDTKDVEPTHSISGQINVWRPDEVDHDRLISQAAALEQAEHSLNGFVVVDRIIEEE
jgi:aspartyl/glutamyl-tRNA(Asn/Gln) amidotransferase C subunit